MTSLSGVLFVFYSVLYSSFSFLSSFSSQKNILTSKKSRELEAKNFCSYFSNIIVSEHGRSRLIREDRATDDWRLERDPFGSERNHGKLSGCR